MKVVIFIYDGFTALDAIGPYEMLACVGGVEIQFVAKKRGVVFTDTRSLPVVATKAIEEIESANILLVPGGPGDKNVRSDAEVLDWIRKIHEMTEWTVSVCTGSLILAATGLLKGKNATTHWHFHDVLRQYGANPVSERWVTDGKFITAAGVSAGIDMALYLISILKGSKAAQIAQLATEYDPAPPFDAGAPGKAPVEARKLLEKSLEAQLLKRLQKPHPIISIEKIE